MDAERFFSALAAVCFGLAMGASLGSGKTLLLQRWHEPRIVQRRKEPFDYWIMVLVQGVFAALCVWGAAKVST